MKTQNNAIDRSRGLAFFLMETFLSATSVIAAATPNNGDRTLTQNPYESSAIDTTIQSILRFPIAIASLLNLGASMVIGAAVANAFRNNNDTPTEDVLSLFMFFISLASIFGIAGAYLGCRHIHGRLPILAIPIVIGTFAIILLLTTYSNTSTAATSVAALAAGCALSSTAIARTISRMAIQKDATKMG